MMVRVVCANGHASMAHARRAALGLACPRCGVRIASRATPRLAAAPGGATGGWLRTVVGGGVLVVVVVAATWGLTRGFSVEPSPAGTAAGSSSGESRNSGPEHQASPEPSATHTAPDLRMRAATPRNAKPPFSRFEAIELARHHAQRVVDRHYDGGIDIVSTLREFVEDPVSGTRKVLVELSFRGELSRWLNRCRAASSRSSRRLG